MWDKMVSAQYRRPSGLLGRWIGRRMARQHQPENQWTIDLLDARPDDRILEIGFGAGVAIYALARQVTRGLIAGIDYSRTMVAMARRCNQKAIHSGLVDIRYGEASILPFDDQHFDKVFSIHSIYFWSRPMQVLQEIHRVLSDNGTLILTLLPEDSDDSPDGESVPGTMAFTPYSGAQIKQMLHEVGFATVTIAVDSAQRSPSNYSVVAVKSSML